MDNHPRRPSVLFVRPLLWSSFVLVSAFVFFQFNFNMDKSKSEIILFVRLQTKSPGVS